MKIKHVPSESQIFYKSSNNVTSVNKDNISLLQYLEFENIYSSKECSVQNFYQPHGGRIQKFSINDENFLIGKTLFSLILATYSG